jgi:hypothetical protein
LARRKGGGWFFLQNEGTKRPPLSQERLEWRLAPVATSYPALLRIPRSRFS